MSGGDTDRDHRATRYISPAHRAEFTPSAPCLLCILISSYWFAQGFAKVSYLHSLAPTQKEPLFFIAQGIALVLLHRLRRHRREEIPSRPSTAISPVRMQRCSHSGTAEPGAFGLVHCQESVPNNNWRRHVYAEKPNSERIRALAISCRPPSLHPMQTHSQNPISTTRNKELARHSDSTRRVRILFFQQRRLKTSPGHPSKALPSCFAIINYFQAGVLQCARKFFLFAAPMRQVRDIARWARAPA